MTRSDFLYTQLPGTLRGFIRRSSLWEGGDHFLVVRGTRFSEEYRRFYYRDIEALLVQQCARPGSIGWWLVNIVAFGIAVPVASIPNPRTRTVAVSIAVLLGVVILIRLLVAVRLSCRCFVQTAVSREELPSLQRRWTADKALSRLRLKIEDAQGAWAQQESNALQTGTTSVDAADALVAPAAVQNKGNPARSVNLALVTFALVLVDAAQTFWAVDGPRPAMNNTSARVLTALLVVSMGGATVWSLLSTNDLHNLRGLRKLLLATLLFEGIEVTLGRLLGTLYSMDKGVVNISLSALRAWHWLMSIDGALCVLLGCSGLIFVLINWENLRRGDISAT